MLLAFAERKRLSLGNRCPQCGSRHTAEIVYRYLDVNYFSMQSSENHKRTYLGSCVVQKENYFLEIIFKKSFPNFSSLALPTP